LPGGATARVLREHPRNPKLLFLGTELGAFVSFDRGGRWTRLKGNLPLVRVDDIQIHPRDNDLVLGTHGRSIWVLDDITALEQMTEAVLESELHLFDMRPATQFRLYGRKGNTGHKYFSAPNPPYNAVIAYYLKSKPAGDVKVTILDKDGKVVREGAGVKEAGINRMGWDLRHGQPVPQQQGGGGGGGFIPRGPRVQPGEYTVRVSVGQHQVSKTVRVEDDPRIRITAVDRARWQDASIRTYELQKIADAARRSMQNLKSQTSAVEESLKKKAGLSASLADAVKSLDSKIDTAQRKLIPVLNTSGSAGPPLPGTPRPLIARLGQLAATFDAYTAAPTSDQTERMDELARELKSIVEEWNRVVEEATSLNNRLRESGIQTLNAGERVIWSER
ncbi:MAG TPA: hypothetical protein VJQ56_03985, partial [Blastocatellia bacterium]|nr:hypothetical protein [Blastocatellia bacterium]